MRTIENDRLHVCGIIPARYASTRLPAKPLALIMGKPMIQWVYEQASRASTLHSVVVATDDKRIEDAVHQFGGVCVLTSSEHSCGTDRISEVVSKTPIISIAVNIQGDEPLIAPESIDLAVHTLIAEPTASISTVVTPCSDEDFVNPNAVKVVLDSANFALYFSRSPIPYPRNTDIEAPRWKHLGLYAYRREFLLEFSRTKPTPLAQTESLEQLRALEMGRRIVCAVTASDSIGVDTQEDLLRVEQTLRQMRLTG